VSKAAVSKMVELRHNRARLALHELRGGDGRALLLLHGLGEQTPMFVPDYLRDWPGPVHGLDFTGHGASTRSVGGGYTAEILMGDVDAALAYLGPVTILGRGLGAYIGLLAAGARPELVRGVVLADGPGLVGGGIRPGSAYVFTADADVVAGDGAPDAYALFELSRDVRPPDYAQEYVRQAMQWSGLDRPIAVTTVTRPEWIEAVVAEPGVVDTTLEQALREFAA
jgi:pimeloyl-ACP methyl ester carboxylesterase